ncbi:hypothetical protein I314_04098 [Cryptococcus bacillisporus CA1873]|uniref:Uncharacterized protein n=2 Tax=Cryptococcus gattii TaxID=552467 RepID=A0A0D0VKQ3_CRYGA|nr:hypothetical protein I312_03915 [Cryptococcus bacillisporus CA1280]KIR60242.1 hypothetical protein I314_04098 [Cryptococcus bacillisporus CA1873]|eukprot:KIR60242.1 hypothetical protein I314_04098 [Cryptococcus gattii CA1873]
MSYQEYDLVARWGIALASTMRESWRHGTFIQPSTPFVLAGKGDKYVSKGDYPACKKKPSLRVLAAADAIRKTNPNSSATRSQFIFTVYLQAGSITISAQPEPRVSHQFY